MACRVPLELYFIYFSFKFYFLINEQDESFLQDSVTIEETYKLPISSTVF